MLKYSFPCKIYCKGPEGEQLEFVQALGPVKEKFEDAMDGPGSVGHDMRVPPQIKSGGASARRHSVGNNRG
jgi:hypothetical protein